MAHATGLTRLDSTPVCLCAQLCQVAATVGGAGAAGGFLLARFSSPRYKPAKFRDIMAKVEEEVRARRSRTDTEAQ